MESKDDYLLKVFAGIEAVDTTEVDNDGVIRSVMLTFNDVEWDMLESAYIGDNVEGALENVDTDPNIGMWPDVATFAHYALMSEIMNRLEEMGALDEKENLKEEYRRYSK